MNRLALAIVVLSSSTVVAQPQPPPQPQPGQQQASPQYTREFDAGVDAYRLGHYDEAREHLEKAMAFDPKLPGSYRFLAAVDDAQQKWQDCVDHIRTAIKLNPASSNLDDMRKLHDKCRDALGKAKFNGTFDTGGAISVTANETGATVTLNGLTYGATPLEPRSTAVGEVEIGVTKLGWLPQKKTVDILPGIVTDVDFTLEPDPNVKSTTDVGSKPTVPTTGFLVVTGAAGATLTFDGKPITLDKDGRFEADPGVHELEVSAPGDAPWRRRVRIARGQKTEIAPALVPIEARASSHRTGLIFASVGTLVAIAAGGAGIYSQKEADLARNWAKIEAQRKDTSAASLAVAPLHTRAEIDAQSDKARSWGYISEAGFGVAAIAIGVGAYFLVKDRPEERDGQPAPFAIAPLAGDSGRGVLVTEEVRW